MGIVRFSLEASAAYRPRPLKVLRRRIASDVGFGVMPQTSKLPLSALLAQALIAFTIEFDDQIKIQYTSKEPPPTLAMWSNVLRFVGTAGIDERRLPALSGISKSAVHSMVATLERHGWIVIKRSSSDKSAKTVRLTGRGRKLWNIWESALMAAEERWQKRYGAKPVKELRRALEALVGQFDVELPHYPMAMAHRGGTPTGY